MSAKNHNTYLASKPRYEILDGLRGVAAIIVVIYHQLDLYGLAGPIGPMVNHGYLAVDFFFILSGYVIGYAYDDRWDRMTLWSFFKRRLIRLHPMIIFATLLGVLFFFFGTSDMFPLIKECSAWMLAVMAILSILMIPTPRSLDIRGWDEFNAINGNIWSLFFEYIANILYALVIRRCSKIVLAILVAVFGLLTANLALNIDIFGVLTDRTAQAYTMNGGWVLNAEHMLIGTTRLLFPFFAGLLLSRIGKKVNIRAGFWVTSLLLATALIMPHVGGSEANVGNGIYELACIILLFPLIVAIGAGSNVSGRSARLCKFLGDISYPLYLVNYPIVYTLLGGWVSRNPDAPLDQTIVMNVMIFGFCIFMAYAALKVYDEPTREWLKKKLFRK